MAIRLKDVAQHLKLSVSTVSAALQNREDISEARMIALVEGAIRQRTPNEIALTLVLSAFFSSFSSWLFHFGRWRSTLSNTS
jgi:high-affinity K+ transport system ATPase subunit B